METLVPILLEKGLLGVIILMQGFAIRALYRDLTLARSDRDDARGEHLTDLRELSTRRTSNGSGRRLD